MAGEQKAILLFALIKSSLEQTITACKAGALEGADGGTLLHTLLFALKKSSVELALLACKAGALATWGTTLSSAVLNLALARSSVELALVVWRTGSLNHDPAVVSKAMHFGVQNSHQGFFELVVLACRTQEGMSLLKSHIYLGYQRLASCTGVFIGGVGHTGLHHSCTCVASCH